MTDLEERIAVNFLESILIGHDLKKENFYSLLGALEQVPYLTEVRPMMHLENIGQGYLGQIGLHIYAQYIGDKQIGGARVSPFVAAVKPEIQEQVDALYADLAARTGFSFRSPSPDLTSNCCTARVLVERITTEKTPHTELSVALYKK